MAQKQSRPILKRKDKGEVNNKGKISLKESKLKETNGSK